MLYSEKMQRLSHLRNGISESAWNSELETLFKPSGPRQVIKSGSSHRLIPITIYTKELSEWRPVGI